jgi:hypothetical protein
LRFCALTSVGALFYFSLNEGISMKKKFTDEEIGQIIGKVAEKSREEMDFDFRVAESQMQLAENELAESLNEEQLKLYKSFCEKRKVFYEIASEIFERKF